MPLTLLWYLLILNWFHTLSCCFHCWLWTSKSRPGSPQKLTIFQILRFQLLLNWSFKLFSKTRHLLMMTGSEPTQPAFTCSKLTIETLIQRCEICSKLTIKTPKRRWRRFGFFINFEHISHLCSSVSIVNFEHVIAGWVPNYFRLSTSGKPRDFRQEVLTFSQNELNHSWWRH